MWASVGEPTSQVISIPTSSEDEKNQRDISDYGQGAVEEEEERKEETDYETDKQIEAIGLSKGLRFWLVSDQQLCGFPNVNPNSLIERLEFFILETRALHDGLYVEMLHISKQLLSINFINQKQLDNFVFHYGK